MLAACHFITAMFSILSLTASAQKKDTAYFNDEGFLTRDKASAIFYRVYTEKDSVAIFNFTEYHNDGSYVLARAKDNIEHPRYVGLVKLFDKQAHLIEQHEYDFYGLILKTWRYHANGTLLQALVYNHTGKLPYIGIMHEADSTGTANIVNGNGQRHEAGLYRLYGDSVLDSYEMSGPYRDGFKNGEWIGSTTNDLLFKEHYKNGKLTDGSSIDKQGKVYKYSKIVTMPDVGNKRQKVETAIKEYLVTPTDTISLKRFGNQGIEIDYTIDSLGKTSQLTGFKSGGIPIILPLKKPYRGLTVLLVRGRPVNYRVKHGFKYGYYRYVLDGKPIFFSPVGFRPQN